MTGELICAYNVHMGRVFDELAKHLTDDEREDLLGKIRMTYVDSSEPLFEKKYEQTQIEHIYHKMSLFEKLIVFLKMLFGSKDRHTVLEEIIRKRIYREISERVPGMIDFYQKRVLSPFFDSIRNLEKRASVFMPSIRELNEKGRSDFYAYLADMEMPDLSDRIQKTCIPRAAALRRGSNDETILRQEIENTLDEIIADISPVDRQAMYYHAKTLSSLREFALYPYQRILSLKNKSNGNSASFSDIQPAFLEFLNILHAFEYRPGIALLEGLFLFSHLNDLEEPNFRVEVEMQSWIERCKESIAYIKTFLDEVPLVKMYLLISNNLDYIPRRVASGEDWFALFRNFWMGRLGKELVKYSLNTQKEALLDDAARLIGKDSIYPIPEYSQERFDVSVCYMNSLSFLDAFLKEVFMPTMNTQLKRILIDGEFYRDANASDYSAGYGGCLSLDSRIEKFCSRLLPDGEYGKEYETIINDMTPHALKEQRIRAFIKGLDNEVRGILEAAYESFSMVLNVVNGILYGEKGGRYDTLSNMGYLGGRDNQAFIRGLKNIHQNMNQFYQVLQDMKTVEEKICKE